MKPTQKVTQSEQDVLQNIFKEEGAEAVVRYVIATNPPVPVSTTEASEYLIQLGILKENPFEKKVEKKIEEKENKKNISVKKLEDKK